MHVQTASTKDGDLLRQIRFNLDAADEAILAVAFVTEQGVHLLRKQLAHLRSDTRLLATTSFGTTTVGALHMAHGLGTHLRILNPGSGTFHSKAFLTRCHDGRASLVIGSSNLTGGLVSNIEVGTVVRGQITDQPIAETWDWAEQVWQHHKSADWQPDGDHDPKPVFDGQLLGWLRAEVAAEPVFHTLSRSHTDLGLLFGNLAGNA